MKFNSEEEKTAYIASVLKIVAEITHAEPHPTCPGYTVVKSGREITQTCLKLEGMMKEVDDGDVKLKILDALKQVESFYEKYLNDQIDMPFNRTRELPWYDKQIALLEQSMKEYLSEIAPTAKTLELYSGYVERYKHSLGALRDSKTPGHPAYVARLEEEQKLVHEAMLEMLAQHRSGSPLFFETPDDYIASSLSQQLNP